MERRPSPIAFLLALLLAVLASTAQAAPTFPALTGRVVDEAAIIPPDVAARLDGKLAALEQQSRRQFVVATVRDLQGYDIADYGYQLGRHWGIGSKARNDGVLLIVAPGERKLRIEVGYGLEGVLTDGLSSLIIEDTIVPRFKDGDMAGGIEAGADAIIAQLSLPAAEAERIAADVEGPGTLLPLLFVFGLVALILGAGYGLMRLTAPRYSAAAGGGRMSTWHVSGASGTGSGSGWSSSSSSFSGGGGSFGGGGASGSW